MCAVRRCEAVNACLEASIDRLLRLAPASSCCALEPEMLARRHAAVASALCATLAQPVTAAQVAARAATLARYRRRLAELLRAPGVPQRTPEWYAARQAMVTASDIAQALGCAKFGTQRQFFQKKCGAPDEQPAFNAQIPPLKWGIMYEPVACAIYAARNRGVTVHEFGLLRHAAVPHLGASPDGVTEDGVMLEIKCPWRRKIVEGEIPMQYYYQMQGQLEVCGLDECDYAEFEFREPFDGVEGALLDELEGDAATRCDRGVFVEAFPADGADAAGAPPKCEYAPLGLAAPELRAWARDALASVGGNGRAHWWRLEKMHVQRVVRDPEFVADVLLRLEEVWRRVLRYRADRGAYEAEVLLLPADQPSSPTAAAEQADKRRRKPRGASRTAASPHSAAWPELPAFAFVDDEDDAGGASSAASPRPPVPSVT
jgi:putative phage-type endonuclease